MTESLPQTILLVEDDPTNVRVFSKILTKRGGFNVRHTENAEEVLAIAQAQEVDLVLMDVSLSHSMYQASPWMGSA
jgi:two-component system, cell cycle response regulator DivK